jgi:hypothetical protein
MYGPVKEHDQWRCRYNKELYDLFKEPRLPVIIRIATLQWAGHVTRMEENSMPRGRDVYATGRTKKSGNTAHQVER